MKRLMGILAVVSVLALAIVAAPAFSATEATVTATVSTGTLSIVVTPTNINYGAVPLNSNKISGVINVASNGSMASDVNIKGSNANGTIPWTLSSAPGAEQFRHSYSLTQAFDDETNLTTGYLPFVSGLGGNVNFKLKIYTPTSTNDISPHTTTVTLQAVAPP